VPLAIGLGAAGAARAQALDERALAQITETAAPAAAMASKG
jgi:hypothetical protein